MIVHSIITKSQLESALRLDAEYYQPEFLDMINKVNNFKVGSIGNICDILRGNTPKEYGDFEISVVRSGDLSYGFINDEQNLLKAKKENTFFLNNGDVLISSIGFGSIGKVNIFFGENDKLATVAEVTVLRNCKINPFFVWGFLRSKFGQFQIDREITGATGQLHLNTGNIANIIIPAVEDKVGREVENYYREAEKSYQKSKDLYQQAENLLLEELGLKNFKAEDEICSIVNLSDVKNSNRLDAEFFQTSYKKILNKITKKLKLLDLENIFEFKRGLFISTDYYTEEKTERPYIRIKELSAKGPIDESKIIFINEKFSGDENNELKCNDLVIAIIGDTIGKTNLINKKLVGGFCSNNTGRLRLKLEWREKIIPEYSEILFQSMVIQSQVEQKKAQTGQPKISDNEIRTIRIPVLPRSIQQKIADLVRKSHEARKKAKELLAEAKRKVEEMIENKK